MPSIKVRDIGTDPVPQKNGSSSSDEGSEIRMRKRTISNQKNAPAVNAERTSVVIPTENEAHEKLPGKSDDKFYVRFEKAMSNFFQEHSRYIRIGFGILILIAYHVYFGFAIAHSFSKALALVVLTIMAWVGVIYYLVVKPKLGPIVYSSCYIPLEKFLAWLFQSIFVKM